MGQQHRLGVASQVDLGRGILEGQSRNVEPEHLRCLGIRVAHHLVLIMEILANAGIL